MLLIKKKKNYIVKMFMKDFSNLKVVIIIKKSNLRKTIIGRTFRNICMDLGTLVWFSFTVVDVLWE